jgi:hypothetical protein
LWKKEFLSHTLLFFDKENKQIEQVNNDKMLQELYAQIGQLKVENDFLKKKLKQCQEPNAQSLSIVKQCKLLSLRGIYYYEPIPESAENLAIMLWLDKQK